MSTRLVLLPSLPSASLLALFVTTATACGPSPLTTPASIGSAAASSLPIVTAGRSDITVDLLAGTFTLTMDDGSQLTGAYVGQATLSSSGRVTSSLQLDVTGGTGALQGATGSLKGDGTGGFTDAGAFSLSLEGVVSTPAQKGESEFRTKIRGTSTISCGPQGRLLSLGGDGHAVKGDLTATFQHTVGNTGCSP
jgi:hypothetical protein